MVILICCKIYNVIGAKLVTNTAKSNSVVTDTLQRTYWRTQAKLITKEWLENQQFETIQDYTHPEDCIPPTYEMTPWFEPFSFSKWIIVTINRPQGRIAK